MKSPPSPRAGGSPADAAGSATADLRELVGLALGIERSSLRCGSRVSNQPSSIISIDRANIRRTAGVAILLQGHR